MERDRSVKREKEAIKNKSFFVEGIVQQLFDILEIALMHFLLKYYICAFTMNFKIILAYHSMKTG